MTLATVGLAMAALLWLVFLRNPNSAPDLAAPAPDDWPAAPVGVSPPRRDAPAVAPSPPEVDAQEAATERTGMELFPPMGSKPTKVGIVVPEDYDLPPGYMRHYQATDDGTRLPAILVFHPDHQPLDAAGQPVLMPSDGVVPVELAPPGLPIELLRLPAEASARSVP